MYFLDLKISEFYMNFSLHKDFFLEYIVSDIYNQIQKNLCVYDLSQFML